MSYDLSRLLPVGDSTATVFEDFKEKYGANDNVYLVSTEDPALFELEKIRDSKNDELKKKLRQSKNKIELLKLAIELIG